MIWFGLFLIMVIFHQSSILTYQIGQWVDTLSYIKGEKDYRDFIQEALNVSHVVLSALFCFLIVYIINKT